jgi:hypothetical protein
MLTAADEVAHRRRPQLPRMPSIKGLSEKDKDRQKPLFSVKMTGSFIGTFVAIQGRGRARA